MQSATKKGSYADLHGQLRPYYERGKYENFLAPFGERNICEDQKKNTNNNKEQNDNYLSQQINRESLHRYNEDLNSNDSKILKENKSKINDDLTIIKDYILENKNNNKQNEEIKNEIKLLRKEIGEIKSLLKSLFIPNDNDYSYIPKPEFIPPRKIAIQMDKKYHIFEIHPDITLEKLIVKSKECFELSKRTNLIIHYFNKFGTKMFILNEGDFKKSLEDKISNYYANEDNKINPNVNNIQINQKNEYINNIYYDDDNNKNKYYTKPKEELDEKIYHFASLAQKEIQTKIEYYLNSADCVSDFIKGKKKDPEKLVNTDEIIKKPGLLDKKSEGKDDMDFILSLIGEILKDKNVDLNILKSNDEGKKDKNKLSEACLQYLFCGLLDKKKIEINFKLNQKKIDILNENKEELSEFIKVWIEKISNKMNVNKQKISLINPRKIDNSFSLDLVSNDNDDSFLKDINKLLLNQNEINFIKEKAFIESCQLNNDIFDPNYNNQDGSWGSCEKRGGEDFLPPIGWKGYALNVKGKYDGGDDTWLDYDDREGVFAVAYLGLSNIWDNKDKYMKYLGEVNLPEILKMNYQQTYKNDYDLRSPRKKCGCGVYLFQDPKIAENSAGIIDIIGIRYKVLLMCRVNPKKIRQPVGYKNCWILNPTPDEIRPYRILVKTELITPLAEASQEQLKFFEEPSSYYKEIIDIKDISFYQSNNTEKSNKDYVIYLYTDDEYKYINKYLRYGKLTEGNYTKEKIKSLVWCLHDSLTSRQSNVPNSSICFRGVALNFPEELKVGKRIITGEFFSTTKSLKVALTYSGYKTLFIIRIENNKIPPGFYCYDIENISKYQDEREILITFNCVFEITKKENKTIKKLKEELIRTDLDSDFDENQEVLVVNMTCLGNYYDLKNSTLYNDSNRDSNNISN